MTTPLSATNIIDGKAVNGSSGQTREVYNPSTGEILIELTESTVEDGGRARSIPRVGGPHPRRPLGAVAPTCRGDRGQHRRTGPPGDPRRGQADNGGPRR